MLVVLPACITALDDHERFQGGLMRNNPLQLLQLSAVLVTVLQCLLFYHCRLGVSLHPKVQITISV